MYTKNLLGEIPVGSQNLINYNCTENRLTEQDNMMRIGLNN